MIKTQPIYVAHKRLKDAATRCVLGPVDVSKCVCCQEAEEKWNLGQSFRGIDAPVCINYSRTYPTWQKYTESSA